MPPNYVYFPHLSSPRLLTSWEAIQDAVHAAPRYLSLPMIYNSFIHRDLIEKLRGLTGRVFRNMITDIYTGFAFAHLVDRYVDVGRPMRIDANSAQSMGIATLVSTGQSALANEFHSLNAEAQLTWHFGVPHVPKSLTATVTQCFEDARQAISGDHLRSYVSRKSVLNSILSDLRESAARGSISEGEWQSAVFEIDRWIENDLSLRRWFASRHACVTPSFRPTAGDLPRPTKGIRYPDFCLDGTDFDVRDTYGVAELYEKLYGRLQQELAWQSGDKVRPEERLRPTSWLDAATGTIRQAMPAPWWFYLRERKRKLAGLLRR